MASFRLREMGIRAALGATPAQLAGMTFADTTRYVGAGLGTGLVATLFAADVVRAFLFQVKPLDPITLAVAALMILGVALLVSMKPALRAARVDVSAMLREG
jgi:putative ABC transport system permease protein